MKDAERRAARAEQCDNYLLGLVTGLIGLIALLLVTGYTPGEHHNLRIRHDTLLHALRAILANATAL